MRITCLIIGAAVAIVGYLATISPARAQTPYYELQGEMTGIDKPRTWYSVGGILDVDAGMTGSVLQRFGLQGSWGTEDVEFSYRCEGKDGQAAIEMSNSQQCLSVNKKNAGIRRFSIRLAGKDADSYSLTYRCWVALDGHSPTYRGARDAGDWCGITHSDEAVSVTRILISVARKPTQSPENSSDVIGTAHPESSVR